MKLVDTKDAVGTVLCHDITQIIKGVTKDSKIQERSCSQRRRYPVIVIPWKRSFIRLGSRRRYAS